MARRRTLILVAALAGLVALVAVASGGHSPTGGGATHNVDWRFIWEFVLVGIFALFIISFPIFVWTVYQTRTDDPMRSTKRRQRSVARIGILLIVGAVFVIAAYVRLRLAHDNQKVPKIKIPTIGPGKSKTAAPHSIPFDWAPAIVIISIAVVAAIVVTYLMFRNPPRRPPTKAEIANQLSALLDDSLDDLRTERDPRKAVIATYARMERTLAGFGFPRAAAEAPREYLGRVLRDLLEASADAVSRLTDLFERAKFSPHEIDPWMKNDAIDALVEMRDELRAAVPA